MANRRGKVQAVRLSFLGLQNYCGQWLQPWNKKMPSPWKESYDKSRQHIKKHRHLLDDEGLYSQSYGFSNSHVWMTECQRIDAIELWCWRRLLRVPWTARRSNWSILKETNHLYSLEGLMLKLKLQHFGHLMQRANSLENILMLGKIEGKRRGLQRMRWLDSITDSMDVNLCKLQEIVEDRGAWCQSLGLQRVRHNWAT